jgi:hypothetical protein
MPCLSGFFSKTKSGLPNNNQWYFLKSTPATSLIVFVSQNKSAPEQAHSFLKCIYLLIHISPSPIYLTTAF